MLVGIRNAQSLVLDGKHLLARYEGPVFKGYYESPNPIKGVRNFYCIQSTPRPDEILFLGDIILDQVYSFDQGYNALEAMAKGKVVFTGAENEFIKYYNLTEKVALNALPDLDYLVKELDYLIENPNEIIAIGTRARKFIEKEHK
jgi:hypothetical protein